MLTITSSEAKTRFTRILDQVQREPIRIKKQGKSVAILLSETEYSLYEAFKLASLQQDLTTGIRQAEQGLLMSADEAFADLL
jgi:PHD/YefM family antitoxin component YafN of YafNO toxin-antitoxin module